MRIELPFPPSANHYWKRKGNRYFISTKGYQFRDSVLAAVIEQHGGKVKPFSGPVCMTVELTPPDRRKRDLDNFEGKALWDALCYANVLEDDSQVKERHGYMRTPDKATAGCIVIVEEL